MITQRIAQTSHQQKSEKPQASGILQCTAVRSVSEAGMQSTENPEELTLSNSAFSKDFSAVPISTTKSQQIMTKLMIGSVGDKYEQEADRVAASVVQRLNAPASMRFGEDETVQREEMETNNNEAKLMRSQILQRMSSNSGMAATPDLEVSINQARGGGQAMADNIREPMEQAFGADFSGVRVHTDAQSDQLNRSIQGRAFTTGQDVFFRQGAYQPGSQRGQELIAHELTHVVQQNGGFVARSTQQQEQLKQHPACETLFALGGSDVIQAKGEMTGNRQVSSVLHRLTSTQCGLIQCASSDNKNHHQEFLAESIKSKLVNINETNYIKAEAYAYILDHHLYKRTTNALAIPDKYKAVLSNVALDTAPQDYINYLYDYINNLGTTTSQIQWGAMTTEGTGSSVHVKFAKGGHAEGSPTNKNTPWMDILSKRRDGNKPLYVMGHLLNADLGGPGLDYNYVPLTGRGGWYGANNANGIHSDNIEQTVKQMYQLMDTGQADEVTELEYHVEADFKRPSRTEQIGRLEALHQKMICLPNSPTLSQVNLNTTLNRLPEQEKNLLKKEIAQINDLEAALSAVSSLNYWTRKWITLTDLMKENIELWKYEDRIVPLALHTSASWKQFGAQQERKGIIPVQLPIYLNTPYASTKKTALHKSEPEAHQHQFQQFLNDQSDAKTSSDPTAVQASLAAFLMDMNEYDRKELQPVLSNVDLKNEILKRLHSIASRPDNEIEQDKSMVDTIETVFEQYLDTPGFREILSNDDLLKQLIAMMDTPSEELYKLVQAYVQGAYTRTGTGREVSKFEYSGKTPWGSPSTVVVKLEKEGHPSGSSAGGDPEWMLKLEQRKDRDKTLYVRGHMINRHLGGAGLDYNMVPLTGRAGWYGANNANAIHSNLIEEIVKNLYSKLRGPQDQPKNDEISELVYQVEAVFGNHRRPGTTKIADLTKAFDDILKIIITDIEDELRKQSDPDRQKIWQDISTAGFIATARVDPPQAQEMLIGKLHFCNQTTYGAYSVRSEDTTQKIIRDFDLSSKTDEEIIELWKTLSGNEFANHTSEDAIKMLAHAQLGSNFRKPINSLAPADQTHLATKINNVQYLPQVLDAVSSRGNYTDDTLYTLQSMMHDNADLWKTEDEYVPLQLKVNAKWKQFRQDHFSDGSVDIQLATSLHAPFDARDEKA